LLPALHPATFDPMAPPTVGATNRRYNSLRGRSRPLCAFGKPQYVLFFDLLGFTAFVRSSFQKKAEETDDHEKEFGLAQKQFKIAQAEVDREYRRFHEHLDELSPRPVRRGMSWRGGFVEDKER